MANDIGYDNKRSLSNKLIQEDGSITDLIGNPVANMVDEYKNRLSLPNKFLNPDGSYSTLNEIIGSSLDTDIYIIVEELPEEGLENKIYLVPKSGGGFIEWHYHDGEWDTLGELEIDLSDYYTKTETNNLLDNKANADDVYTKTQIDDLQNTKVDKIAGKGLSTEDYTTAEKMKLSELENYDDTEVKEDIVELEAENERLKEDINGICEIKTETGESIDITDSAEMRFAKFDVYGNSKQNILPTGYTLLEYIESTGTQYIDTGYKFNSLIQKIEINFTPTVIGNYRICGSFYSQHLGMIFQSRQSNMVEIGNKSITPSFGMLANTYYTAILEANNGTINFRLNSDVVSDTYTPANVITNLNHYIFDVNYDGNPLRSSMKLYSYKMYDNNILVRDFIPAKRNNDNELGLYDVVNKVFYTNSGTGVFIAGNIIPNPDYPQEIHSVGDNVNLFDGELELGSLDTSTGENITGNQLRTKNYIEAKSETNYSLSNSNNYTVFVYEYNENKEFIKYTNYTNLINQNNKFKTTSTTKYLKWRTNNNNTDITTKFKLEQGTVATPYSPYEQGCADIIIGNRNWFDTNKVTVINGYIPVNGDTIGDNGPTNKIAYMKIKGNTTYTVSKYFESNIFHLATTIDVPANNVNITNKSIVWNVNVNTITSGDSDNYLVIYAKKSNNETIEYFLDKIQVQMGTTATSYLPHVHQTYTIQTQQPMRKIGDYADTFVKENGIWYEKHVIDYISSYNNEEITTTYMSTTGQLTIGAKVQYIATTPTLLPCTSAQTAILEQISKTAKTYKGGTYIYSTDEISPIFDVEYRVDIQVELEARIEQVITSALGGEY